ncbi:TetR/AcrR family transcriptional regulator [Luteimonas lutimaris]|uniref:TetR/AcrR family transcriptional regulator n=1 Tax=Luteimonas lutimaris TaxID=698645 RepID=A0ABP7M4L7_9GAMM|nr:TetR/AcrR family transcriptional regulator [Luteimonas sp.]
MSNTPARKPGASARQASPGRPKDLAKGAAILEAAKRMFTLHGYERASMDLIASEAGVSKLTVYSHFGDKDALFAAAVKSHCETQLPDALFEPSPDTPLRERLLGIARAFFAMVSSPEAVAGHRIMCSPQVTDSPLPEIFWKAGPERVQTAFSKLLQSRIDAGQLEIPDVALASSQFFALLKGEVHARMVFGCCSGNRPVDEHLDACVDMFLRAYGVRGTRAAGQS